ncbi:MAG: DNA polymerase III subunit gamma/tau [Rickettsiaceae bacterium]|nr:DNA polymerase III subunit gamma/tau [Rickettsiaceae bacterium]
MEKPTHINLARKYRPKNLPELRGQEVLVQTISNAIKSEKIAQSYIFTGIRGVGKTTTARIIAKTVNCTDLQNLVISCEKCINCQNFNNHSHPDIVEMDAASRTGVDDVRIIIESAEYKPMMGKFKVFIIDEVHMLSKNAFNALLKLLEEPPSHCIFIFATTEIHKVPLTVISRCQRFDLPRINMQELTNLLSDVCEKENVRASKDAIEMIAFKGDGSARDCLSLLDQAILISTSSGEITKELVHHMILTVDAKTILEFFHSITQKEAARAINLLQEFYSKNSDFNIFINSLLSLIAYIGKKKYLEDYKSPEFYTIDDKINSLIQEIEMEFIQISWKITYKTMEDLKISPNQLHNMEMLVLKLIYVLNSADNNDTPANTKTPVSLGGANWSHSSTKQSFYSSASSASENRASINSESHRRDNVLMDDASNYNKPLKKFDFEEFIRHLATNKEMELFYHLFNKVEIIAINDDSVTLAQRESNRDIENGIRTHAQSFFGRKLLFNFIYQNDITSYKNQKFQEILLIPSMQRLSKNFPGLQMVDIIVSNK